MTQNSSIKGKIRARMAETGEPYSVAARAVRNAADPVASGKVVNPAAEARDSLRNRVLFMTSFAALLRGNVGKSAAVQLAMNSIDADSALYRELDSIVQRHRLNNESLPFAKFFEVSSLFTPVFAKLCRNGEAVYAAESSITIWRTELELM
jgi:hypothetical protein